MPENEIRKSGAESTAKQSYISATSGLKGKDYIGQDIGGFAGEKPDPEAGLPTASSRRGSVSTRGTETALRRCLGSIQKRRSM